MEEKQEEKKENFIEHIKKEEVTKKERAVNEVFCKSPKKGKDVKENKAMDHENFQHLQLMVLDSIDRAKANGLDFIKVCGRGIASVLALKISMHPRIKDKTVYDKTDLKTVSVEYDDKKKGKKSVEVLDVTVYLKLKKGDSGE